MTSTDFIAEPRAPQVVITREFDAPREFLFRAHIDPDLLVQWLAPRGLTMTVDRFKPPKALSIVEDTNGSNSTVGTDSVRM